MVETKFLKPLSPGPLASLNGFKYSLSQELYFLYCLLPVSLHVEFRNIDRRLRRGSEVEESTVLV